MQIGDITNRLDENRKRQLGEIVRFAIVGVLATLLQYLIYWILIQFIGDDVSKAKSQFYSSAAMTVDM